MRRRDAVASLVFRASALVSILVVALVVLFLVINSLPLFNATSVSSFMGSTAWNPDAGIGFGDVQPTFGALTPILGSVAVVALALLIAVPLALAVAITAVELHPRLGERVLRPVIEALAGVPSVVFGYVGFIALLPLLRHLAPPGADGSGILASGIVLGIMVIPFVMAICADALRAVPATLREASDALGATQWQTIRRVVFHAARGGVVSGIVLGFARAMGEALAVSMVIGDVNVIPDVSKHGIGALLEPFTTMTVTITDGIDKLAINPQGTAARYALATVLLLVTFLCVGLARRAVKADSA